MTTDTPKSFAPGSVNPNKTCEDVHREIILAADFGVPAKYNEEAQRFAEFMVARERERCARIAEDMDYSPHGAIASAIRNKE